MERLVKIVGSKKRLAVIAALVVLSFLSGYRLKEGGSGTTKTGVYDLVHTREAGEETGMVYVCPMMCVPPMEKPGRCPICGMDLIPVFAGREDKAGPPRIGLTPEAVKLAAIQTAPVERKFVSAEVRLFGRIDYDPAHVTKISAFMPGVIDRVYVKRAGQFVRWGDPLFDISSSDLLETQKELVEAMKYVPSFMAFQSGMPHAAREMPVQEMPVQDRSGKRSPEAQAALNKIAAIRHKLSILGLPKRDIDELMKKGEATGIATVYSSIYGQVIEQNAYEGTYVNTGTPIFVLGDPRYVWARLDAYEVDYPWIRKGQEVVFQTDAYPGENFEGNIVYIDPVFNAKTRTFSIGAICPDPGGSLKSGMLVRAVVRAGLGADGKVVGEGSENIQPPLVIPDTAPLITGKRAVVYVALPEHEDRFEGREVILGPRAKDHYVVLGGLEEGERVVKNGSFKIDSAVQILAKRSMMDMEAVGQVNAYQRPGGAGAMDRDYLAERRKSRMLETERSEQPPEISEKKDRQEHRSRFSIRRRKPGAYGDTTRQPWDPRNPNDK